MRSRRPRRFKPNLVLATSRMHQGQTIRGWFTEDQGQVYHAWCKRIYGGRVVEVGNFEGLSLSYILDACVANRNQVTLVDPETNPVLKSWIAPYSNVDFVVQPSPEAAAGFLDESLDLVFIDGDHTWEAVTADIKAWWPKVKPGGCLAGHDMDLMHSGVVQAVIDYADRFVAEIRCRMWRIEKPHKHASEVPGGRPGGAKSD